MDDWMAMSRGDPQGYLDALLGAAWGHRVALDEPYDRGDYNRAVFAHDRVRWARILASDGLVGDPP